LVDNRGVNVSRNLPELDRESGQRLGQLIDAAVKAEEEYVKYEKKGRRRKTEERQ
jgi:hypothetical protein